MRHTSPITREACDHAGFVALLVGSRHGDPAPPSFVFRRASGLFLLLLAAMGVATAKSAAGVPLKLPESKAKAKSPARPTLFVSPSGSDPAPCTRSHPCSSFASAYSLAKSGAHVEVARGSYGVQTMSVNNAALTASQPVVFRPPAGVGVSQVTVAQLNLTGASNVSFQSMTFGSGAEASRAWYQRFSSNTLCDGCLIHGQLAVDGDDH